jgi:tetratricopeptide (TPR) repeat protein
MLAIGADAEMLSGLTAGYLQTFDAAGRLLGQEALDGEHELRDAWRFLRDAVARDPDLLEARLRLGRVLYRRGDLEAAARELEIVRSRATDDIVKYLSAVFLAAVETRRGRLDRASELYDLALRVFHNVQTAVIGQSQLAYLRGRPAEAAALMVPLLERRDREDPWWVYVMGEAWHLKARLASLRAGVQR